MKKILATAAISIALAACGAPKPDEAQAAGQAAGSASTFQYDADGIPKLRPGLWEISHTEEGEEAEITRICLNGLDEKTREGLLAPAPENCTKVVDRSRGLSVGGTCQQPGGTQLSTNISITGSETRFTTRLSISMSAPGQEPEVSTQVAEARWVSPCTEAEEAS